MTVYKLFEKITAVQTLPTPVQAEGQNANLPPGSREANLRGGGSDAAVNGPLAQTFQAVLNGSGNCSATVQLIVSNDGINWMGYGAITIASGTTPHSEPATGSQMWARYSAYVSAISGTNASCTCYMNA